MSIFSSSSNDQKSAPPDKNWVVGHAIFSGIIQLLFWISYFEANWQSDTKCQTFHFSFLGIIIIDLFMTLHRFYRAYQLVTQNKVVQDIIFHPLVCLLSVVLGITLLIIRKKICSECKDKAYMAYFMSGLLVAYWLICVIFFVGFLILYFFFANEDAKKERERQESERKKAARQATSITPKKGFKWPWSRGEEEV